MKSKSNKIFIRKIFSEWYQKNYSKLILPPEFEKREFGFFTFKEGVVIRHKRFTNLKELLDFIKENTPSDIYYSAAYYENPEAEMEYKGWLGADLVFDIDADHVESPCDRKHDFWICKNCKRQGFGSHPRECPDCGESKFEEISWMCKVCLESAKDEAIKLVDVLVGDFSFSQEEIKVFFSGHRGYHLHIESKAVRELKQDERKEIVDYLMAVGLNPKFHGVNFQNIPSVGEAGWRGRMAMGAYQFLLEASESELKAIGIKGRTLKKIIDEKDAILEALSSGRKLIPKGIGLKTLIKIYSAGAKKQSIKIDPVVTVDIHRLIRLGGSLHGKTGLMKIEVPTESIESFNPFKNALAFKNGEIKVKTLYDLPELIFSDEIYGPFKANKIIEVPTQVAVFFACKNVAEVVM